jgi:hypothetical protein
LFGEPELARPILEIAQGIVGDAPNEIRNPVQIRRNTRTEQMFSASPKTTDMRWLHRNDRFVPLPDSRTAAKCILFDHFVGARK